MIACGSTRLPRQKWARKAVFRPRAIFTLPRAKNGSHGQMGKQETVWLQPHRPATCAAPPQSISFPPAKNRFFQRFMLSATQRGSKPLAACDQNNLPIRQCQSIQFEEFPAVNHGFCLLFGK